MKDDSVMFNIRTIKEIKRTFKLEAASKEMSHGDFLRFLLSEYKKARTLSGRNIFR